MAQLKRPQPPAAPTRRGVQSQPRNPKKTGFLDLPAEIRNQIYGLALVTPKKMVDLKAVDKRVEGDYQIKALRFGLKGKPAILAVCKQIWHESSAIYFEENHFCFTDSVLNTEAIEAFAVSVPKPHKIHMVSVARTYHIVEQKVNVRFTAIIQPAKIKNVLEPRVLIHRADRLVFPGIKCAKVGDFVEPCRCDVKRLAWKCHTGKETDGKSIITFLLAYVATVNKKSKTRVVKACEKCGAACRY